MKCSVETDNIRGVAFVKDPRTEGVEEVFMSRCEHLSSVMICFLMAGFTSRWIIFLAMMVLVARCLTQ